MSQPHPAAIGVRAAATAVRNCRGRIATPINYVDRQALGVLAPGLPQAIGWNEIPDSHIVGAFQGAFAVGLLLAGRFPDPSGTRAGYAAATGLWSLATTMGHALVGAVAGFGVARFFLGQPAAASAAGVDGFGWAIGGMSISRFTGLVLQITPSYMPVFLLAGSLYLTALWVIHILAPRREPAAIEV